MQMLEKLGDGLVTDRYYILDETTSKFHFVTFTASGNVSLVPWVATPVGS